MIICTHLFLCPFGSLRQTFSDELLLNVVSAAAMDALYNAGIQEQEQLENFPLAERTMVRFLNDFPEHEGTDNVFYHLFLLYGRLGDIESAEEYRGYLLEECSGLCPGTQNEAHCVQGN